MTTQKVPKGWQTWCASGNHGVERKAAAVLKCLNGDVVRGHYSDLPLHPDLDHDHSMYPSLEHLEGPDHQDQVAVEARIINHMKAHLSEREFWQVVEHFFVVGLEKGKIKPPFGKRLPEDWSPQRHYSRPKPARLPATPAAPAKAAAKTSPPTVIPVKKAASAKALDLDGILLRLQKLKPRKRATAVNSIMAMFQFTSPITTESANRLLNGLVRRGALTFDANDRILWAKS
jgi:hypothetical protein